jgi:hypothetical protein
MATTGAFELPDDLLQRAIHASRGRTQQEALTCLLDTSVWNRLDRAPALAAEVTTLLHHGEVGYSDIERLEVLRSAGTPTTINASQRYSPPSRRLPSPKRRSCVPDTCRTAWVVDKGSVS